MCIYLCNIIVLYIHSTHVYSVEFKGLWDPDDAFWNHRTSVDIHISFFHCCSDQSCLRWVLTHLFEWLKHLFISYWWKLSFLSWDTWNISSVHFVKDLHKLLCYHIIEYILYYNIYCLRHSGYCSPSYALTNIMIL